MPPAPGSPDRPKRPAPVTAIGWLFIAAGAVGLAYHATDASRPGATSYEVAWVLCLRVLAVAGGAWLLRGSGAARWIVLAWLAYHVVLSVFHSLRELVAHAVLLALVTYFLLRADAAAYFRGARPGSP